jgi:hypothetical protein
VTAGVVSIFLPYVQEDLEHDELERANSELSALESLVGRLKSSELGAPTKLTSKSSSIAVTALPSDRRRLRIKDGAVVGVDADGRDIPRFLTGYVGFQQLRDDVERLPSIGANLIQIEIGPYEIFPSPGVFDQTPIVQLIEILDRAAKSGVVVDVLLSPHYFPEWMLQQTPELRKKRSGFVQYCIHHPAARELLRRHVHNVVDAIKDHPALLSVCLANEPKNIEEPCEYATRDWHKWLQSYHGGLEGFNTAHGTKYQNLAEIPLPNPFDPPSDRALFLDYVRFNQEEHSEWFEMLANAVHEVAPSLPVHIKALTPQFSGRAKEPEVGLDPTLLARVSTINGNDGYNSFSPIWSSFAQSWQEVAMGNDLQWSLKPALIFNSENHLITDRESRYIPPEHLRTALWQAAVHGQAATAIWVWGRSFDRAQDFWGSILERPDAIEVVGHTNLDLNRVAVELRALQDAPPDIEILSSISTEVWDDESRRVTDALYAALSFTGFKIGFVTERQLEVGIRPKTQFVFVPGIKHLSARALSQLARYDGRLVFVGDKELLNRDDHNRPLPGQLTSEVLTVTNASSWRMVFYSLNAMLQQWKFKPHITARDTLGNPLWGVEWRSVQVDKNSWLVNLCNYRRNDVTFELLRDGTVISGKDVLSGVRLPRVLKLGVLETKLVRIE